MGPVDYIVLAFPGNNFKGEILQELKKATEDETIRIVDLIFITKSEEGDITAVELENMPPEIAGVLTGLKAKVEGLLAAADIEDVGALLPNNCSAGVLVFEHLWAKGLKQALLNANGILVADGRIHSDDVEAALEDITNESKE